MTDRRVRVVHVVWRFSRHAGVQSVVRRLADGIDPSRVELHVVQARAALDQDELDEVPAVVHSLGFPPQRSALVRLRVVVAVARCVWSIRPDVMQFHSGTVWMGLLAWLRTPRLPMVLEVHDAPGSGRSSSGTDRFEGRWARLSRATLVAHSTAVATQTQRAWRVPPERIATFPLCVEAPRETSSALDVDGGARRADARRALGLRADSTVVLGLGRLVPSKRFDRMVEALAALRDLDVEVAIVGLGDEDASLDELARSLGVDDRLHLLGRLGDDELAAAFAAADVLGSTSEYEGFGLSLIEAMVHGVPVVAMAVGGVTDIVVDGETGFLVGDGDLDAFVARVRDLALDRERRDRLGAAARARAEEVYSPARMVEAFTDVYLRAARGRG